MTIRAVVFDVNQTLFSLDAVRDRFERTGLGGEALEAWFATVLRDGFALAASDGFATFRDIAGFHLRRLARARDLPDPQQVADEVIDGFGEVTAHPDVADGMRALRDAGLTLATFTNGTSGVTRSFLERTGIDGLVQEVLDVAGPERWKPRLDAYRWACDRIGVRPKEAAMVAVHPWDIQGARTAGMTGVLLDREGGDYPDFMAAPDITITTLTELAAHLA